MINYEDLKEVLKEYMSIEYLEFIDKCYEEALIIYKDMKRMTGDDYITHPLGVAYILAEYKMDPITIGCALIHEAITLDKMTYEEVESKFGEEAAVILDSISKISSLKQTFKVSNPEKYRRVIVGLAENPAALFIKFADRLHNLRTLSVHDNEHMNYIIEETNDIYIPLAHRLGMKRIKSEMEDLCLRYSDGEEYQKVLDKISASKDELTKSLEKMKNEIILLLESHNIEFEILTRVKSVRGVYNKLKAGKKWEEIYDLLGLRVLVNEVEECYLAIGLIQSKYPPLPKRFKDYIANPKANMYQSLHTTVFGEDKRIYEVQVRTYDMDEIAEKGVASHWSYKERTDGSVKNNLEHILETFRTQIELNDIESNMEFFGNIKEELKRKDIYVFTPKGDVIELPAESTPVDFAYKIHSEVGDTTTGALVNGKMVRLDHELSHGDLVELITQKGHVPSKDWLSFVKTDGAKSRIKSYFYKNEREKYVNLGKEMLLNECKKRNASFYEVFNDENISKLCEQLNLDNEEDIYFSVSTLRYLPSSILNRLNVKDNKKVISLAKKKDGEGGVVVAGSKDILYSLATCCHPVYGEDIVGYITKGYGVKIHSKDCKNIKDVNDRLIDAYWEDNINKSYNVHLKVYLSENSDIMLQIITLSSSKGISIEGIKLVSKNKLNYYDINCKVKSINDLNIFIDELKNINCVKCVERVYS
ncbi:MAG: bifunctional (p)ppGpp synthetase/guanosine-3',5'-bis(diphosphate) 3'-pyrophosphohydrolase [Bacilli bacterium]|nr:bifunctional (p)ppGpp synthetase/guanosine-3',5'-bis(diphosphate) 3'-pyrophosphohydrolase [Bacilli bacterium]